MTSEQTLQNFFNGIAADKTKFIEKLLKEAELCRIDIFLSDERIEPVPFERLTTRFGEDDDWSKLFVQYRVQPEAKSNLFTRVWRGSLGR
jgi:hypothetical protein